MNYLISFLVGGLICGLAQILVVRTSITTSRILVLFLMLGVVLQAFGVYPYFKDFAKAGATVPIIGFGATLAKGAIEGAKKGGLLGVLQGGLTATAGGIAVAIVSAFLVGLIFNSRTKHLK
ncbi:MAG: SpoVA/SpoVAEb family sporulation membrane protein [Clostridia bacterium]|nr:SpoVA/SpoVAEb family sporulation membrane protein [Clostridia bacterium]